ncbi:16S rRNA (uracil(1498)-N(3))-methyltransferase [candidate division KSB1 bacterium]|nr:16S rRNA (uracil(1498)-N(3))-methyltransferase [candidate division KSB1 bacterium]
MNLILLFEKDFINGTHEVRIDDRRLKHMLYVHRVQVGDKLKVGLLNGKMGSGNVIYKSKSELMMKVRLTEDPPPPIPVTLLLALPRPKMLKRILFAISSMGVKKLYLFNSYRVEKSFWQAPILDPGKMEKYLTPGLEQAKDTVLPQVELRKQFKPFFEDEVPEIMKNSLPLIADPGAEDACPYDMNQQVTLAMGPEGGFIPYETDKIIATGFKPVHLGKRILRVENAVVAGLSRLF